MKLSKAEAKLHNEAEAILKKDQLELFGEAFA